MLKENFNESIIIEAKKRKFGLSVKTLIDQIG